MNNEEIIRWAHTVDHLDKHRFFRTSGTSGIEKWIALSDRALEWSALAVNQALNISAKDTLGLALPEIHVGGFGLALRARLAGATLARFNQKWHAQTFTHWCQSQRVTVSSLVPTQLHDLVHAGCHAPAKLRLIVIGGGVLSPSLLTQARELHWPVVPSYGMTETSSQVATGDGLPLIPGWEAQIIDGRIALRGGGLLTAEIHRSPDGFLAHDPKIDGWFITQDLGRLTQTGLEILGRADRHVKVLGKLVNLDTLEETWRSLVEREVAIIPLPHARNENSLALFYEGSELNLAPFNQIQPGPERLTTWQNLPKLPRSPLGKIDRYALKNLTQFQDCKIF